MNSFGAVQAAKLKLWMKQENTTVYAVLLFEKVKKEWIEGIYFKLEAAKLKLAW